MVKKIPKYLRQTTTGRIYAYAAELAKRNDMVPYFPEPVVNVAVQPAAIPADLTPKVEPPATVGKGKAKPEAGPKE